MADTFFQFPKAPRVTHPETKPETLVSTVEGTDGLDAFLEVPELAYWADPYRIPPIRSEEVRAFHPDEDPLFARGKARLFTARHGHGRPVGRIAAFIDGAWDERTGERWGFFGRLEFMNDARLPEALLDAAVSWLRAEGAQRIVGPFDKTPWRPERGTLVDGFYDDPIFLAAYSPPSYPGFLEALGLETHAHELGYELDLKAAPPESLLARASEVAARDGLRVRRIDLARIDLEWELLRGISAEAHTGRKEAPAPPREEWDRLLPDVRRLLPILPEGALVLEEGGKPVGFALALVDWNRVKKHQEGSLYPLGWLKALLLRRTIDRVRVHDLAVVGAGRGRALPLVAELWRGLRARGYTGAHVPGVPEGHARARALLERIGARRARAWRLWCVPGSWPQALTPHRA